jgi:putative ABC transport system permease protein
MPSFLRRFWHFVARDRNAADLEEEMRLHIDLRARQLELSGMSMADARGEARRQFGNPGALEERSADVWGFGSLDLLRQDVRFALRRVRQNPASSIPVVAVLALGIGATTAVFSAVDAALLRPLPFLNPHELYSLTNVHIPSGTIVRVDRSPSVNLQDVWQMRDLFANAAGYASGGMNLSDAEHPVRVNAGVVTSSFFATLGVSAAQGRTFSEEEGKPGGPTVTVLSHAFWHRQFGGAPMVGRRIMLHDKMFEVVGIMPPGFSFPNESDLWIPLSVPTSHATFEPFRGWLPSTVIARTATGIGQQTARAKLLAQWQQNAPAPVPGRRSSFQSMLEEVERRGAAVPLQSHLVGDRQRALLVLMGATVLLLLIACANVANLMLSDASGRRREIAVRQVLGATRRRILRQLLVESLLLAVAGALIGLAVAPVALSLLRAMLPANLAGVNPAHLDLRVLGFATGLVVITAIAFGLWPAVGASRQDASATIKAGGGHGATAGNAGFARRVLVTFELALTVMLLIAAGLMIRSFDRLISQDFGMRPDRVATLEMTFSRSMNRSTRLRTITDVVDRIAAHPGIDVAGAVNDLPLRGSAGIALSIEVDGAPRGTGMKFARFLLASAGYFDALGIDLQKGRTFTAADDSLAPRVAIISKTMEDTWWPSVDALGRTFRMPGDSTPITVVGVVDDVREGSADEDPDPQMYFPVTAETPYNIAIVARGTLRPELMLARMQDAVRSVDRRQAVFNVRMMEAVLGNAVAPRRTNTLLIAIFAGLALLLAALGVYAVMAYGVAQRSREFGIRAALGATARDIVALVTREMAIVIALGVSIGVAAAWGLSRVLAALLYGVDTHDPATFGTVPVVLVVAAVLATLIPAWRATRVSPTEVMRAD